MTEGTVAEIGFGACFSEHLLWLSPMFIEAFSVRTFESPQLIAAIG